MFTSVNFRCDSKLGFRREQMVARVYECKRKAAQSARGVNMLKRKAFA
jgi:hypothetical protein